MFLMLIIECHGPGYPCLTSAKTFSSAKWKLGKLKFKIVLPEATKVSLSLLYFEFLLTTEGIAGSNKSSVCVSDFFTNSEPLNFRP